MAPEPFLTLPLRSCRDLLHARHRARQIARLLRFDRHDALCIAAGAFVVAQQAKSLLRRAEICFVLAERHLRVFARSARLAVRPPCDLYLLSKPVPAGDQQLAGEDIAWLIRQVEQLTPSTPFDEIAQQNQEVLALLAEIRSNQASRDPGHNPTAA